MADPMASPTIGSGWQRVQKAVEQGELPTSLPAAELKRHLKAAGVSSSALKQSDGIVALVELAKQKRVSLATLKRQSTSEAVLRARDRETAAMGDGANDLAMIEASGLGVAYHAKPVVAAAADCGISVNDLTAVLYFQGFTDSEIVWEH